MPSKRRAELAQQWFQRVPEHVHDPELALTLLRHMYSYTAWDLPPTLYYVYTDHLSEMKLLSTKDITTRPRAALRRLAVTLESGRKDPHRPVAPPGMLGVALMWESWSVLSKDGQPMPTGNLADRDDAIESRQLIAHLRGEPPLTIVHERDSKNTGRKLHYPVPGFQDGIVLPGNAGLDMFQSLRRITDALTAPPATFLA